MRTVRTIAYDFKSSLIFAFYVTAVNQTLADHALRNDLVHSMPTYPETWLKYKDSIWSPLPCIQKTIRIQITFSKPQEAKRIFGFFIIGET